MPFIFASHLHDILFVRLLNAGLPWMASARGLACKTVCLCHLPGPGTGQERYMCGPGLEKVWNAMERGLEGNGPLQHRTATVVAHLYQIRNFRAEAMQQAILRLQAGSS